MKLILLNILIKEPTVMNKHKFNLSIDGVGSYCFKNVWLF